MVDVTVSTKYQVVIPLNVRKFLNIQPGQKMRVIAYSSRIVLIPVRPIQEARGSLKGMDASIERDNEERI